MQQHPILNVNDDILLLILTHIDVQRSWSSFRDAISISHVCGRWRRLTTNHCPALWTKFAVPGRTGSDGSVLGREEILRRCYVLPLDAGWDSWESWVSRSQTASQIVADLEHSSRFAAYCLKPPTDREEGKEVLDALRKTPIAPDLTELRLSGLTMTRKWNWLKLPGTMFGGNLSALRKLILFGSWLDFKRLKIGSNLRIFEAGICSQVGRERHQKSGIPTTFAEWLHILQDAPHLTSLCLNQRYGERSTLLPQSLTTTTTFHSLTNASLTFEFDDVKTFLNHVTLPACETLLLKIHGTDFKDHPDVCIAQIVRTYAKPSRETSNLLDFFRIGRSSFGCGFWRNDPERVTLPSPYSSFPRPHLLIWFDVNASWDFASPHTDLQEGDLNIFLSGWHSMLEYVTDLSISWAPVDFIHCLPAVQRVMPRMTSLRVVVCPVSAIGELEGNMPEGRHVSLIGYTSRSQVLSQRVCYSPRSGMLLEAQPTDDDAKAGRVASLSLHGPPF